MKIRVKTVLFKTNQKADGTYPVTIRLNHGKKRKYISLSVSCFEDEWSVENELIIGSRFKKENEVITREKRRVDDIIHYMRMNEVPFSMEEFNKYYEDKKIGDVFKLYDEVMEELEQSGRLGNKAAYKQSKTSVEKFVGKDKLMFNEVDVQFLNKYEAYHLGNGCRGSGIAVYLRSFRSLFNIAIQRGLATREMYPFKNQFNANGYNMSKLKAGYNPKALDEKDLEKLKNFDYQKHPDYEEIYRTAMFIFYCRGINYIDLSYLKWSNIQGGRINYIRKKTGTAYSVKVSEQLQEQLDYFKGTDPEYIFPVLSDFHKTESQKRYRVMKKRAQFNKKLKEIAVILEINDKDFTSYMLRHSFATTLKRKGADISLISQAMGHKNVEITNHYLKSFGDDKVDALDDLL